MFRKITVMAGLMLLASLAQAGEAGKVIFVAGNAQVLDRSAVEGAAVQEGDLLQTGADGFLYIKTVDKGLFILRPNTKARIVSYHIDSANPANTRIKLELISGIARSKSGEAVKHARQNFRFNTPVAAIGVRGTDFTVFTDQNTSRVSVISGGIVVSGFADACRPEGVGPCEGAASRELSATQRGQLLQIRRGALAPQLLNGTVMTSDQPPLPEGAEALGSASGISGSTVAAPQTSIEVKRDDSIAQVVTQITAPPAPAPGPAPAPAPTPETPPIVTPPLPGTPVVVDNRPDSGIIWGRWQRIGVPRAPLNLTAARESAELLATKGNYALLRTPGKEYQARETGSVGFALRESEAFIYTDYGNNRLTAPATVSNGRLRVDFGTKSFTTSFDLASKDELFKFQAQGVVSADGRLYGDLAAGRPGYVNLQGLLSNEKGGSAAYIFDGRIDERRTVNGATYWRQ